MRRLSMVLTSVLLGSCLVLGGVVWVVLAKEQRLRQWERRESELLLAQRMARSIQDVILENLKKLQAISDRVAPTKAVAQLERALPVHPVHWHSVWLRKDGELAVPSLAWEMRDDSLALRAAKQQTCDSFLAYVRKLQVGMTTRLAAALAIKKRFPDCSLWSWTRVALLQDASMRWRSRRMWRFSSSQDAGYWLLRGASYVMLLRTFQGGWLGFALRLNTNLKGLFPQRLRRSAQAVWLDRQPTLSQRQASLLYVPLPGLLNGYGLYLQSSKRREGYSWLLGTLVLLCVLLAGWASILSAWLLRKQQRLMEQREDLFASITHELKTPVAAQMALLETLERGQLTQEQRTEYEAALRQEVQRMRRLTENVLAMQRDNFSARSMACVDLTALSHSIF